MIKLIRCDDRMIHGQCIVRVIGDFKINRIIGVDDFTAGNDLLKNIYKLAMPPEVSGDVFTTRQAIEEIRKQLESSDQTLVLFKNPLSAVVAFQEITTLPKEFNIGPMSNRKDTKKATMYAYLNDEEITALNTLSDLGVRVYFNQVIDQKTEEWSDIRKNLR